MNQKIRLGPVAIFLTVIAAVLATLAILTVATSRADYVLAERFAKVTGIRYGLEADGSRFLQALDDAAAQNGAETPGGAGDGLTEAEAMLSMLPEGSEVLENGHIQYTAEQDGYTLTVEAEPEEAADTWSVVTWKITKQWDGADPFEDLWPGMQ